MKYLIILLCLFFSVFSGCNSVKKEQLIIAAASNMQFVLQEIINQFEIEKNSSCHLITASSGKLTAQIEAGAPYDIFISANAKYPEYLMKIGVIQFQPKTIAFGKLVAFSNKELKLPLADYLISTEVKKIALPNLKTAPYGEIAKQALENMNVYNKVLPKLVYGESVSQTNQFVILGAADVGFTSKSIVFSRLNINKNQFTEIDDSLYESPKHQLVIINSNNENAKQFVDFLQTEKAQQILVNYGYELP